MASSSDVRAGRAFVELYLKKGLMVKGLQQAQRRLVAFGGMIRGIGTKIFAAGSGVAGSFVAAAKQFAGSGAELAKLSRQTGASVDQLSRLRSMAQQTGVDFEDVAGATEELNIRLGEAIQDKTGPLYESFQKLGLSAQQLADMPVTERFATIGEALRGIQNQAERGFLADEIMGGDAFKMLPLLMRGREGFAALNQEAERLGSVMSEDDANAAVALTNAWTDLKEVMGNAVNKAGAAVASTITDVINKIVHLVSLISKWINENRELVKTIFKVGALVAGIGAGLILAGTGIIFIGTALGSLASIFSGIATVLGFVLSPIGFLIAGVTALTVYFFKFTETGRKTASILGDAFNRVADVFRATWGGVVDAIKAGDLQLAGKIAVTGLKLAFIDGMLALRGLVGDDVVAIAGYLASGDLSGAWNHTLKSLGKMWHTVWSGMVNVFSTIAKQIVGIWSKGIELIGKGMTRLAHMPGFRQAFKAYSGVDLVELEEKNRQQHIEARKKDQENIAKWQAIRDKAQAEGRKVQGYTAEEAQRHIDMLREHMQTLGDKGPDLLAAMDKAIEEDAKQKQEKLEDYLNTLDEQAAEAEAWSEREADDSREEGLKRLREQAAQTRKELGLLRKEAADAAAAAAAERGKLPGGGRDDLARGLMGAESRARTAVTFSAQAASMLGASGEGAKIAQATQGSFAILRKIWEERRRNRQYLRKLARMPDAFE